MIAGHHVAFAWARRWHARSGSQPGPAQKLRARTWINRESMMSNSMTTARLATSVLAITIAAAVPVDRAVAAPLNPMPIAQDTARPSGIIDVRAVAHRGGAA